MKTFQQRQQDAVISMLAEDKRRELSSASFRQRVQDLGPQIRCYLGWSGIKVVVLKVEKGEPDKITGNPWWYTWNRPIENNIKIICDATNNQPDVIAKNELHASISIKPQQLIPTLSREYFFCDLDDLKKALKLAKNLTGNAYDLTSRIRPTDNTI